MRGRKGDYIVRVPTFPSFSVAICTCPGYQMRVRLCRHVRVVREEVKAHPFCPLPVYGRRRRARWARRLRLLLEGYALPEEREWLEGTFALPTPA